MGWVNSKVARLVGRGDDETDGESLTPVAIVRWVNVERMNLKSSRSKRVDYSRVS